MKSNGKHVEVELSELRAMSDQVLIKKYETLANLASKFIDGVKEVRDINSEMDQIDNELKRRYPG